MKLVDLLRRPGFRLLFAGQALSMFGDSAMMIVLAVWVKDLTGSNAAAGFTLLFVALPSLAAPLGGWLVDRVRRRKFLVVTNLCSAVAMLPLLAVHHRDRLWVIYLVATLYGALLVLHTAALNGLLKTMLRDEDLAGANATLQISKESLRLVAPLVGAALYVAFGPDAVVGLDALTFLGAAVALTFLRVREPAPGPRTTSVRREFAAGLEFLWKSRTLLHVTIALGLALLVVGFAESLVFAVVAALGKPAAYVGTVVALQGVGAVAGGVLAGRISRPGGEVRTVVTGLLVLGIGAALLTTDWLPALVAGVILGGVGLPGILIGFVTLLQRTAPQSLVGRVSTAALFVIGVPQAVSVGLGALLVSVVDYRILLAVMSGGTLLAAGYLVVAVTFWPVPDPGEPADRIGRAADELLAVPAGPPHS